MTNILFICKFNRFRSQVAEAYFNQINKNKKITAKSAGLIRGTSPLDSNQVAVAKKLGVNIKGKPKGITTEDLIWLDKLIITADDVPASIFNPRKFADKELIVWKIKDAHHDDEPEIERAVNEIKKKVEILVKKLK